MYNKKNAVLIIIDYISLQVTGVARADQLIEALKRYPSRMEYVPKILYKIFMLTTHFEAPRPDVIKVSGSVCVFF